MKQTVRIIACDLDGTLLDSSKRVTAATAARLRRAADGGVLVVPATGRTISGIPPEVISIAGASYLIALNGAELYSLPEKKLLDAVYIEKDAALEVYDEVKRIQDGGIEVFAGGYGFVTGRYYEELRRAFEHTALRSYFEASRRVSDDLRGSIMRSSGVPEIAVYNGSADMIDRVSAVIDDVPGITTIRSADTYLEILSAQADKGKALAAVAARTGCARGDITAFGDGLNDIGMIRYAGHGVAMANAAPEVKAAASSVTGSNDSDGIAAYLGNE